MDELARFRLDGRVAVVAGGSGGIGVRTCAALAAVGARVDPSGFTHQLVSLDPRAEELAGPDLSRDGRVEIKIDDHYFTQSDAAVTFRRRDKFSGETRYIYHGNDGTSFPWNDTAQLDYLNPAVREQVIQTILHVARLFPVIRAKAC